jgi:hypothetical protein
MQAIEYCLAYEEDFPGEAAEVTDTLAAGDSIGVAAPLVADSPIPQAEKDVIRNIAINK